MSLRSDQSAGTAVLFVVFVAGLAVGALAFGAVAFSGAPQTTDAQSARTPTPTNGTGSTNARSPVPETGASSEATTVVTQTQLNGTVVADDTLNVTSYDVSLTVTRPRDDTVFEYDAHDAVLYETDGTPRLLVHTGLSVKLFEAPSGDVPVSGEGWRPIIEETDWADREVGSLTVDAMVPADGRGHLAYVQGTVRRTVAGWEERGTVPFAKDAGAYYDGTGYHLFYESGTITNHSGPQIGHATSPNGRTNWTIREPVYAAPEGYATGDYAIVEKNGLYFIFGDYTANHPRYRVAVWVNDDLSTNFTRLGVALAPRNVTGQPVEYGIQDPTIIYDDERGRYVIYAHAHESSGKHVQFAFADVIVTPHRTGN